MSSPVSDPDTAQDGRRRAMDVERRSDPLRSFALGTRNVVEGLLGLPIVLADAAAYPMNRLYERFGPAPSLSDLAAGRQRQPLFRSQGEAVAEFLDRLGLPRAETAQERITGRVVQELAGAATMYGLGGRLAGATGELLPIVGQTLTAAPAALATGATAAGLAGSVAREVAPESGAADLVASLVGGALGGGIPALFQRGGSGTATAAARFAAEGQDAVAENALRHAGADPGGATARTQAAADDAVPAPTRVLHGNDNTPAGSPAGAPADTPAATIPAGGPASPPAPSPAPTPPLVAPAIVTGPPGTNRPRMTAQQARERLVRPSPPVVVQRVPGLALPQAVRESRIILDGLAAEMAIPPHRRPALQQQPGPLREPVPGETLNVPQIMGHALDATRLSILAPGLRGPHGYRPDGRGDLEVLTLYVQEVVRRLVASLDPVVVRLARGERVPGATQAQINQARAAEHYNLKPTVDAMLEAGLPPHAVNNRVDQEAALLAATSPRTNTTASQRSTALYGNRSGFGWPIDSEAIADAVTAGYNLMPSRHSPLVERALRGLWTLSRNPKLLTYRSALAGDRSAVPIDSNKVRYILMMFNEAAPGVLPRAAFASEAGYGRYLAAYRNGGRGMSTDELREVLVRAPRGQRINGLYVPSEYTFYHDILAQAAHQLGLDLTQLDALLWFRFGADTGLASPHLTQVGVLNERLARAARTLRISPREASHRYWRNEIPLPLVLGVTGTGALAGLPEAQPETHHRQDGR